MPDPTPAELAQIREALVFYATQENWDDDGACWSGRISAPWWSEHDFDLIGGSLDLGETARAALAILDRSKS